MQLIKSIRPTKLAGSWSHALAVFLRTSGNVSRAASFSARRFWGVAILTIMTIFLLGAPALAGYLPEEKKCTGTDFCFDNRCCASVTGNHNADIEACLAIPRTSDKYCSICMNTGDCYMNDFLMVGTNIAEGMLYLSGIAMLVFFVVGAGYWIFSAGDTSKIQQGIKIMKNTVMGVMVILLAWVLVQFFQDLIGLPEAFHLKSVL